MPSRRLNPDPTFVSDLMSLPFDMEDNKSESESDAETKSNEEEEVQHEGQEEGDGGTA